MKTTQTFLILQKRVRIFIYMYIYTYIRFNDLIKTTQTLLILQKLKGFIPNALDLTYKPSKNGTKVFFDCFDFSKPLTNTVFSLEKIHYA